MRTAAIALTLLSLSLPAAAQAPEKRQYKVEVDGSRFRIITRGEEVRVVSKAMMVVASVETRDKMKRAVKQATGCEIDDPFWIETTLMGKLRCETK